MTGTVAIVQARMSSTRLPGKVMMSIAGKPMLERVVMRVQNAQSIDRVVVATTADTSDNLIAQWCQMHRVPFRRGSTTRDVLDDFYQIANILNADVVVRVTADCPLLDRSVLNRVVDYRAAENFDYVNNVDPPTYPDGLDCEAFTADTLHKAWREARLASDRQHVTPYIRVHRDKFSIGNVTCHLGDLSAHRWTVDEPTDLEFVRLVYGMIGTDLFGLHQVIDLMQRHPELRSINAGIQRNAGYELSLNDD